MNRTREDIVIPLRKRRLSGELYERAPKIEALIAELACRGTEDLPSPARPILPLHQWPALLAGVAIVKRVGPEMLQMLRSHTVGENRTRFSKLPIPRVIAHDACCFASYVFISRHPQGCSVLSGLRDELQARKP